jgi:hypothetical protein
MELGIVEREFPVTAKPKERAKGSRGLYQLSDNFFRFWYSFVFPYRSELERGDVEGVYERHIKPVLHDFAGKPFEGLCREWMWRESAAGRLPFRARAVGRWWDRQDEIDVMAVDNASDAAIVGECKFRNAPVDRSVLNLLRDRAARTGIGQRTYLLFSLGGTELIGITAGETEDPKTTIPRATNDIIWRILVFYIGALGVIMAVVPWNTIDGKSSPFVQIFDSVGIHAAAGILNFVCLTAVMSVYNSGLYANSRMLYSLAKQGNAPAYLGKLNSRGVPVAGVLTSAAITAIAVVVVFVWPEFAFNYLMSIATIAGIINWTMIMLTEMKFRKVVAAGGAPEDSELAGLSGQEALDAIHFKLPFAKVTPWVVLAFLALVVVLMCFSTSYRIAVIAGVIWLAILFAAYQLTQAKK